MNWSSLRDSVTGAMREDDETMTGSMVSDPSFYSKVSVVSIKLSSTTLRTKKLAVSVFG